MVGTKGRPGQAMRQRRERRPCGPAQRPADLPQLRQLLRRPEV